MTPINPSKVPEFNASFFRQQVASAPPGQRLNAMYLGQQQLDTFDRFRVRSEIDPLPRDRAFTYKGVNIYPVGEDSHYLATFVDLPAKTREERISELITAIRTSMKGCGIKPASMVIIEELAEGIGPPDVPVVVSNATCTDFWVSMATYSSKQVGLGVWLAPGESLGRISARK